MAADWSLVNEPFDNLDAWVDNDSGDGVSEINPPGYLDMIKVSTGAASIYQDFGTVGTGDYTVEVRLKLINLPANQNWVMTDAGINLLVMGFRSDGAYIHDGASENRVIAKTWDTGIYYTVRYLVHNSQTDVDIYIDGLLEVADADCSRIKEGADGLIRLYQFDAGGHWSVDYLKMDDGLHIPEEEAAAVGQVIFISE